MDRETLSLYYHTVSRMHPRQLVGVAERKVRNRLLSRLPVDLNARYERRIPDRLDRSTDAVQTNLERLTAALGPETRVDHRSRARDLVSGELTLIGHTVHLAEPAAVPWEDDRYGSFPRLWTLQLYAFRPLEWAVFGIDPDDPLARRTVDVFDAWIRDWVETTTVGVPGYLRARWTPYSVSLRLVNWARYLTWRRAVLSGADRSEADTESALARELYKNALFLSDHVEHDVGGNHLVENGVALVVAGRLFAETAWLRQGQAILADASRTQFLDDGGHFERSPMYHLIVTMRYLTACDFLDGSVAGVARTLCETAREAVEYLRYLRPPDGRLPLLNDAVRGQTVAIDDCLRYADAIGLESDTPSTGSESGATGYHWLANDAGHMLVDGGPVGPPHLPAHSHNDLLQVLLWVDGHPIVTDTGVFEYAPGPRRQYARSVRAHNTVQVDDVEPIHLGGRFLMGDRTAPETRRDSTSAVDHFEGVYEGKPYHRSTYRHHRSVYAGPSWWLVWDVLSAGHPAGVRSRLHLHPDVTARTEEPGSIELTPDDEATTVWVSPLQATATLGEGEYFPRFGDSLSRDVLEFHRETDADGRAPLGFVISLSPPGTVELGGMTDTDVPSELRPDGTAHRLPRPALLHER